jgi:RimJ/RimL family protein N-acetyltransferase
MRSTLATDVPPNFITMRAKTRSPGCGGFCPAADLLLGRGHATKARPDQSAARGEARQEQTMAAIPTLETTRLILRPYRLEDFDAYAAMWSSPTVVRFIGGRPFSREIAWSRFLRQIGLWHHLGFGVFALEETATGAFAGEAGFHDLKRDLTPSLEGTMEAGWALTPSMQGRGLAEEAMRAAIGWARRHGPRDRLTAIIAPENRASLRVAEKLGFLEYARTTYSGAPVTLVHQTLTGRPV